MESDTVSLKRNPGVCQFSKRVGTFPWQARRFVCDLVSGPTPKGEAPRALGNESEDSIPNTLGAVVSGSKAGA